VLPEGGQCQTSSRLGGGLERSPTTDQESLLELAPHAKVAPVGQRGSQAGAAEQVGGPGLESDRVRSVMWNAGVPTLHHHDASARW
jgi:hypothetical protein